MEAPEKVYIDNFGSGFSHGWHTEHSYEKDIEYIRKDAFIKKATKWLIDNIQNYTDDGMGEHSFVLVQDLNEDFKKYMGDSL